MLKPKVEAPSQNLLLSLTTEEMEVLQWLAQKAGLSSPAELLQDFAADLAGSWRSGGSDERQYAFAWFKRRGYGHKYPLAPEAALWLEEESY